MRVLNLKFTGDIKRHIENGDIRNDEVLAEIAGEMGVLTDSDWQHDGSDLIEYVTDPETLEVETIYWTVESITENPNGSHKIMIDC